MGQAQDEGGVVLGPFRVLSRWRERLEAHPGALEDVPDGESLRRGKAREGERGRVVPASSAREEVFHGEGGRDRGEAEEVIGMRVGQEEGSDPDHARVAQPRDDVASAGVVASAGFPAAIHEDGRSVREQERGGVPLSDREEGHLEPTAADRERMAHVWRPEERHDCGGDRGRTASSLATAMPRAARRGTRRHRPSRASRLPATRTAEKRRGRSPTAGPEPRVPSPRAATDRVRVRSR